MSANIPITNVYDVGRNASVSAIDESAARLNGTNVATALKYLNLASPPLAPEGDPDANSSDGGMVASALTVPAAIPVAETPASTSPDTTEHVDGAEHRALAHHFLLWARGASPRARAVLAVRDHRADAWEFDDAIFEHLVERRRKSG